VSAHSSDRELPHSSDRELPHSSDRELPLVAVGYGPRCVPVMHLVEAATGLCDLLWLVDASLPEMAQMAELLRRFGPVVDVAGRDGSAISEALAPFGPAGIASYLDAGMVEYAVAAESLGLAFHSPSTARSLVDKAAQRSVVAAAGLVVPRCVVVATGPVERALTPELLDGVTWPAMVKPRSAQGSRHTFLAHSAAHAAELLVALGPGREEMVVEGYIASDPERAGGPFADYLSVESIVSHGCVSHLALTGRFPLAENFRETGFFIPAAVGHDERDEVLRLASAAIAAIGVRDGCLHTEVKLTSNGPRLIEVNGRIGGGVHEMLARAAGLPLLELTLRVALREDVRVDGPVATSRIGYRFFLQPPARSTTISEIAGVDAITDHPGVDAVSIHQRPGADLDWRDGSRSHILAVVGSAGDHDELVAVSRLLEEEVTVTYAEALA